jgi:hypothetical protein
MHSFLFILCSFNDVDHITPLIHEVLERGDKAIILFKTNFDWKNDYRIQFLHPHKNLTIIQHPTLSKIIASNQLTTKVIRTLMFNKVVCRFFFNYFKIRFCIFEWDVLPKRSFNMQLVSAAKSMGVKTFSIPHGCNIFLNTLPSESSRAFYKENNSHNSFENRNGFDCYVYQAPREVRKVTVFFKQDPLKTKAWGSLRFDLKWAKLNLSLAQKKYPKSIPENKLKIVFFLPHWSYNVSKTKCCSLIDKILNLDFVYLMVKAHTRGDGKLPDEYIQKITASENAEVLDDTPSPVIVHYSDIILNFGSSIGIEAVLQNKELWHLPYLHENKTIFDRVQNLITLHDEKQVIEKLKNYRPMKSLTKIENEIELRKIIFPNAQATNVLAYYYENITKFPLTTS